MKTGTTWIHNFLQPEKQVKEIYFPHTLFQKLIYNRYVKNEAVLIWPYLLHNKRSLLSLLKVLERNGNTFELVSTCRPKHSWLKSRAKFYQRSKSTKSEIHRARTDLRNIIKTHRMLRSKYKIKYINIWERDTCTISFLNKISSKHEEEVKEALNKKFYETNDISKIPTRLIGVAYFRLKPFLPMMLQNLTRQKLGLAKKL